MEFKDRLKELRAREGLTQKDLGEKLNVTAQAISRWENGEVEPSLTTLAAMGKLFNVTMDSLLGKEVSIAEPIEPYVEEPRIVKEVVRVNQTPPKPVLGVCEQCNKPIYEGVDLIRHRTTQE